MSAMGIRMESGIMHDDHFAILGPTHVLQLWPFFFFLIIFILFLFISGCIGSLLLLAGFL